MTVIERLKALQKRILNSGPAASVTTLAWRDELSDIITALEREAAGKPQWKAGQRLVNSHQVIVRLDDFTVGQWDCSVWSKCENGWVGGYHWPESGFLDVGYVPWPRVGDWVRCTANHGHERNPFQVERVSDGHIYGGGVAIGVCFTADLEPAEPPHCQDKSKPKWKAGQKLVTRGGLIPLAQCDPGFFAHNGELCFKSEYSGDVYCSSGEYFWGGTKSEVERDALVVQPLNLEPAEPPSEAVTSLFKGPHWDRVKKWLEHDSTTAPCILDLAREVKRLAERLNRVEFGLEKLAQGWAAQPGGGK